MTERFSDGVIEPEPLEGELRELSQAYALLRNLGDPANGVNRNQFHMYEMACQNFLDALTKSRTHEAYMTDLRKAMMNGRDTEKIEELVTDYRKLVRVHREPEVSSDWTGAPSPRQWIVNDWLPLGRVALFTGTGGRGKTRLALQLAFTIAAGGSDYLGGVNSPVPGVRRQVLGGASNVVYASWEDERDEALRRLRGLVGPQVSLDLVLGNRMHYYPLTGEGAFWEPRRGSGHVSTMGSLTRLGQKVREYAEQCNASLLVIDPLAAAYASNENERGLVRAYMDDWNAWALSSQCAVLMVAHPSKQGAQYSGSTDWHNASRMVWTLELEHEKPQRPSSNASSGDSCICLRVLKSNYARLPPAIALEMDNQGVWSEREIPGWARSRLA